MRKRKRRMKLTKGERLVYSMGFMALGITILLKIFCGATVSNLKMDIEEINYNIENQSKKIESLSMKISELTSFDNVKDIVKDMGLAYNNDNIVVISD